jgi:hypothetical protein
LEVTKLPLDEERLFRVKAAVQLGQVSYPIFKFYSSFGQTYGAAVTKAFWAMALIQCRYHWGIEAARARQLTRCQVPTSLKIWAGVVLLAIQ